MHAQQAASIIFFYGPPATAKSHVARQVAKHTGYTYLCLDELYTKFKATSDVDRLNKLMQFFQNDPKHYVVDGFLENKGQTVVFFEHYRKPRYVVYFQSSKDEVEQNIRALSKSDEHKRSQFARFQAFLSQRDDMLAYLRKFPFLVTVDAIQRGLANNFQESASLIVEQIMGILRPKILAALTYNNEELAEVYLERLEKELGYVHLNVEQLCQDEIGKGTALGKQISAFSSAGQVVPAPMQIELLRKTIYSDPDRSKFVLTSFPEKYQDFKFFESNLFPLEGLVSFMKENRAPAYSAKVNPVLKYVAESKHLIISNENLATFQAFVTRRTKFGISIGPSASGKTTYAKYIAQKFGYQLVEWESTITQLKEKLAPAPDQPLDEVTLPQIIGYYKQLLGSVRQEKYIFDGFPPMVDKPELAEQFLQLGQFSFVLNSQFDQSDVQIKQYFTRYKAKNEIDAAQEINEEEIEKLKGFVKANADTLVAVENYIASAIDCRLYNLTSTADLESSLRAIDQIFEKRVYLVSVLAQMEPDLREQMRLVFVNIAAKLGMTFVDVEGLVARNQSELKNDYEMRWTEQSVTNPSNFSPERITKLVRQYLESLPQQSRDIILWGYTSADKKGEKKEDEIIFPRPSDELIVVEKNLGGIKAVYAIIEEPLESEINDPEWVLVKPEAPVAKQQGDGDDGGDGQDNKDAGGGDGGDDENKPKFNIYEYQWSKSEGPKNLAQIYMKIKQPNPINMEVSDYSFKSIYDSFDEIYGVLKENSKASFFAQIQLQKPIME